MQLNKNAPGLFSSPHSKKEQSAELLPLLTGKGRHLETSLGWTSIHMTILLDRGCYHVLPIPSSKSCKSGSGLLTTPTTDIRPQAPVSQRQTIATKPIVLLGSICASTNVALPQTCLQHIQTTFHRATTHHISVDNSCHVLMPTKAHLLAKTSSRQYKANSNSQDYFDIWGLGIEGVLEPFRTFPKATHPSLLSLKKQS